MAHKIITDKRPGAIFTMAQALVNPVNCVGVMGAGFAKEVAKRWPNIKQSYSQDCLKGDIKPGYLMAHSTHHSNPEWIINFPTKFHWKEKSQMEFIEAGLVKIPTVIHCLKLKSLAIPKIGCGLGGLDWEEVKPKIIETVKNLECEVLIYE